MRNKRGEALIATALATIFVIVLIISIFNATDGITGLSVLNKTDEELVLTTPVEEVIENTTVEEIVEEVVNETDEEVPETIPEETLAEENEITSEELVLETQEIILSSSAFSGLGSGTLADPYNITNCTQLQEMNQSLGGNYTLGNDINCSNTTTWDSGGGFDPIGASGNEFTGSLDGEGHVITDLFINHFRWGSGLFAYVDGATIKNIGLVDINFNVEGMYAGAFAGSCDNCIFNRTYATGKINGSQSHSQSEMGGLVGDVDNTDIYDSYSHVNISSTNIVGGIVGGWLNLNSQIVRSYAAGWINTTSSDVDRKNGLAYFDAVTNSYWDYQTTDSLTSSKKSIEGSRNSYKMKQQSTYEGWDFTNVWAISPSENCGYPYLKDVQVVAPDCITIDAPVFNETITNCTELQNIEYYLNDVFYLANDIDCSDTVNWNDNGSQYLGFDPIGECTGAIDSNLCEHERPFRGSIYGNGYKITGLYINRTSKDWLGLISATEGIVIIENLNLKDVVITGSNGVGGLIGSDNGAKISNCSVTGDITIIRDQSVGGLVGFNRGDIPLYINNSYFDGTIDCLIEGDFVGGLVGGIEEDWVYITESYSDGKVLCSADFCEVMGGLIGIGALVEITNSYSLANVTGDGDVGGIMGIGMDLVLTNSYFAGTLSGSTVGGLIGLDSGEGMTISNSYWDNETTNISVMCAVDSGGCDDSYQRTTAQMQQKTTFVNWNFTDIWSIDEGNDYPDLRGIEREVCTGPGGMCGNGTLGDPWIITDCTQLQAMNQSLGGNYTLGNNIDCSDTVNWNSGNGFDPIGDVANHFTGSFDGDNHKITRLYINRSSTDYVGLFSYTNNGVNIKNIGLEDVNITGHSYVGSLVGRNHNGIINNSYATGSINGTFDSNMAYVGGLIGLNWEGDTINSYFKGNVKASGDNVGGIIGYSTDDVYDCNASVNITASDSSKIGGLVGFSSGNINNSHVIGNIIGGDRVGGLVGITSNSPTITNSYAIANVTGTVYLGGLVGINDGYITNCYSTGNVSGTLSVGGLVGLNDGGSYINNSYAIGNVNGTTGVGGLAGENDGGYIDNCYAVGDVNGTTYIGGLVGYYFGVSYINNSYAIGDVKGGSEVGGLVGYVEDTGGIEIIGNCFSTGDVTGSSNVGGLIGENEDTIIVNCYWHNHTGNPGDCVGTDAGTTDCTAETIGSYLYNISNPPIDVWSFPPWDDFCNMSGYPSLEFENINDVGECRYYEASCTGPGGMCGNGTVGDPWIITDCTQLQAMNESLGGNYTLGNDIDCDVAPYNTGAGFEPIGNETGNGPYRFSGGFDGNNKKITGLYINRPSTDFVGLFGVINIGRIKNVSLEDVNITGQSNVGCLAGSLATNYVNYSSCKGYVNGTDYVGGLVGTTYGSTAYIYNSYFGGDVKGDSEGIGGLVGINEGKIYNSYSEGTVTTTFSASDYSGGLVGWNDEGVINNSYSRSNVTGDMGWERGGLVGWNLGNVSYSYSTGYINCSGGTDCGGLVGLNEGYVFDSYWDNETSGQNTSDGGTGKPTLEMQQQSTYSGWDFIDIWGIYLGFNDGYPYLRGIEGEVCTGLAGMCGNGTLADPWIIFNCTQLQAMNQSLGGNYTLGNNIDCSDTVNWNDNGSQYFGFEPVGNHTAGYIFTGSLDGNDYVITGLFMNRTQSTGDDFGLFGGSSGNISEVGLEDSRIYVYHNSNPYVGGLVGYNLGTISYSHVKNSTIFASTYNGFGLDGALIGGLTGYVGGDSKIINSYVENSSIYSSSSGGLDFAGGLVGHSDGTTTVINMSYSYNNTVEAVLGFAGGLMAQNGGNISNSYSKGGMIITSDTYAGGLVYQNDGRISKCYSTTNVTAGTGGLVGTNAGNISSSYWDNETSNQTVMCGFETGSGCNNSYGKPTAQMQQEATFIGWNFTDIWGIDEGNDYPYLQWGSEEQPLNAQISLNLIYPTTDINATQNEFFNVTVNVTCLNANCEEINVSLDPITPGCDVVSADCTNTCDNIFDDSTSGWAFGYSGFLTTAFDTCFYEDFGGSSRGYYTVTDLDCDGWGVAGSNVNDCASYSPGFTDFYFCPGYDRKGSAVTTSDCNCKDFFWFDCLPAPALAAYESAFDFDSEFFSGSPATKGLISTTPGATPFYTNESNPRNITLNQDQSQVVTYWVNATGDVDDTYEFFAYANKTSNMSINSQTDNWNVTIIEIEEIILPNVTEFPISNGSTNFSDVPNINNVYNLTLANVNGKIQFPENHGVDAESEDYDTHIEIEQGFVSVNTSALNSTFNASVQLTLNNVTCPALIHYGNGAYTLSSQIIDLGNVCNSITDPACTIISCTGNTLIFTVSHFTGFAAVGNTSLTIWDEGDSGVIYGDQE
ncbi:MAG: GLUG motif-containing protein, partial [Candidatus Tenebribacter davisii]|nr:GLUG motif-containing protein [Candidatus Tenebribacter davisii]